MHANVEMQNLKEKHHAKRSRYYRAMSDVQNLKRGDDYFDLPKLFIIFICSFDMFDMGKPYYVFTTHDTENDLPLNDETSIIYLNTKCPENAVPERLSPLYEYIERRTNSTGNPVIAKIIKRIEELSVPRRYQKIMTFEEELQVRERIGREQGFEDGVAQGREQGFEDGIAQGRASERPEYFGRHYCKSNRVVH